MRLANAGLAGLVIHGSNGEAVHQTPQERATVIRSIREALDAEAFTSFPLIAGCSAQGVIPTVQSCAEAAQAGASYAIVLPPSYYRPSMTPAVLESFYTAVAEQSPIPILMYNYPGAAAGVDMDSDLMARIARHDNVVGAKLTCANTGKLTRLAAATDAVTPSHTGSGFLATGGLADMTLQTIVSGGSGIIAGTANVLPKLCVKLWEMGVEGQFREAMELQSVLARADWEVTRLGIAGTKSALSQYFGYGGSPRRPLQVLGRSEAVGLVDSLREAVKVEGGL